MKNSNFEKTHIHWTLYLYHHVPYYLRHPVVALVPITDSERMAEPMSDRQCGGGQPPFPAEGRGLAQLLHFSK